MKKCMNLAVTTVVMGCLLSFPAFAAETRAEYKEAVTPIREELKALEEEMDAVRTENKALSARFSEIRQIRKETGELIVSKDTWKKARELKARIREVRSSMDSLSIKSLRTQARAAVKEKDFDAALKAMGEAMEQKQDRLDSLKEINAIWKQIDDLLEAEEDFFPLKRSCKTEEVIRRSPVCSSLAIFHPSIFLYNIPYLPMWW